ncbi:MAG: hypothetical protein JNM99_24645 [Verrucomicrobiaceae bacterium]|nr:hypothetical protein [Verrucomicrobiaceae bacterium]
MSATAATPPYPGFQRRLTTLIGLWFVIFGVITALTPFHVEGGFDVSHEKLKATLCAPILGCYGFAAFLGGHRPPSLLVILSLVTILGSTALMLMRWRTVRAFWTFTAIYAIMVTISSIGFSNVIRYWNQNP